mmetsp:Transcript_84581/g.217935  ORF Transcript_84581/g.217935 Transcript_84581/m.217935 type:complete len:266 (-) Transcript_84581:132-929(-)
MAQRVLEVAQGTEHLAHVQGAGGVQVVRLEGRHDTQVLALAEALALEEQRVGLLELLEAELPGAVGIDLGEDLRHHLVHGVDVELLQDVHQLVRLHGAGAILVVLLEGRLELLLPPLDAELHELGELDQVERRVPREAVVDLVHPVLAAAVQHAGQLQRLRQEVAVHLAVVRELAEDRDPLARGQCLRLLLGGNLGQGQLLQRCRAREALEVCRQAGDVILAPSADLQGVLQHGVEGRRPRPRAAAAPALGSPAARRRCGRLRRR